MFVPLTLVGEISVEHFRNRGNGFRSPGKFDEVAEMPPRQRDDHEDDAVAAGEILAVLTIDGVTHARGAQLR